MTIQVIKFVVEFPCKDVSTGRGERDFGSERLAHQFAGRIGPVATVKKYKWRPFPMVTDGQGTWEQVDHPAPAPAPAPCCVCGQPAKQWTNDFGREGFCSDACMVFKFANRKWK
jgi:hypothetical protein